MKVRIDHDLCSGTGHCAEIAPDVFTVRDRRAWLTAPADALAGDRERIRRAVDGCPWFAISHSEEDI
jgi:ferredoxin